MQTARLGRVRPLIPRRQICSQCAERRQQQPRYLEFSSRLLERLTPGGQRRFLSSNVTSSSYGDRDFVPLRKQLKDEAKAKRLAKGGSRKSSKQSSNVVEGWELTVGIEVHAQLDTDTKLFSRASGAIDSAPNSNVALFDLAFPGSQPRFQNATLIPALRAAIAFGCDIQPTSHFDRKHYFYQDQPAGYQITQYYEPYAKNGGLWLYKHDGIAPEDGDSVRVGIKQIQMEQDTAKSQELLNRTYILDFNRVSRPLIEVITLPEIHTPATAAACVKKIQALLQSCGAVTTGIEMGGLRADVNVSVQRKDGLPGTFSYGNFAGLGQRTEIKNLSSFKAVEDAIIAERNRQIAVLEAGGTIEGETRGWTIGGKETRKLRDKEGSVDYRYMPDPDLGPVIVGDDVVQELKSNMPPTPDDMLKLLTEDPMYGLSVKDAKPLIELDDGARLEYYQDAVDAICSLQQGDASSVGRTAGNWVLHELGGLFSKAEIPWDPECVSAQELAEIVSLLMNNKITGTVAKSLLSTVFDGEDGRSVQQIVEEDNLAFQPLPQEEYARLAQEVVSKNPQMVAQIRDKGQHGKIGFFVGQVKRLGGQGRVEAQKAESAIREAILGE